MNATASYVHTATSYIVQIVSNRIEIGSDNLLKNDFLPDEFPTRELAEQAGADHLRALKCPAGEKLFIAHMVLTFDPPDLMRHGQ